MIYFKLMRVYFPCLFVKITFVIIIVKMIFDITYKNNYHDMYKKLCKNMVQVPC